MASALVEKMKDYKEIIGFVSILIAAVFACLNYFAAKQELVDLKCESNLRREFLEARVESEALQREIYSIQQETARSVELLTEKGVAQPRAQPDIRGLGFREDELRRQWQRMRDRQEAAYADIMSDRCQVGKS